MGCEALGDEVMTLPLWGNVAFGPESKGWRVPTRYALARPLSMPEPETEAAHAAPGLEPFPAKLNHLTGMVLRCLFMKYPGQARFAWRCEGFQILETGKAAQRRHGAKGPGLHQIGSI